MAKKKVNADETMPSGGGEGESDGDKKRRRAGKRTASDKQAGSAPKVESTPVPASAGKLSEEVAVKFTTADGQTFNVVVKVDIGLTVRVEPAERPRFDLDIGVGRMSLGIDRLDATAPGELEAPVAPPEPPVAPAVIGGMELRPDHSPNRVGTATIACRDVFEDRIVLLTASHVVGRADGQETVGERVKVAGNSTGTVAVYMSRLGEGGYDVALIVMDPETPAAPGRVRVGAQDAQVHHFVEDVTGMSVVHAGIRTSGSPGRIVEPSAVSTPIVNDLVPGSVFTPFGLMRIEPTGAGSFAVEGDSGAPVLVHRNDGDYDMVGLLIASDGRFGYAHRVTGFRSFPAKWRLRLPN